MLVTTVSLSFARVNFLVGLNAPVRVTFDLFGLLTPFVASSFRSRDETDFPGSTKTLLRRIGPSLGTLGVRISFKISISASSDAHAAIGVEDPGSFFNTLSGLKGRIPHAMNPDFKLVLDRVCSDSIKLANSFGNWSFGSDVQPEF